MTKVCTWPNLGLVCCIVVLMWQGSIVCFGMASSQPNQTVERQGTLALPFPEDYLPELRAILEKAVEVAPELMISRLREAEASFDTKATRAVWMPKLKLDTHLAHQQEYRDEEPKHQEIVKPFSIVRISQPLYHWGALQARVDQAKIQEAIAKGQTAEALRLLLLRVRAQYLQLLSVKQQALVQEKAAQIKKNNFSVAEHAWQAKLITNDQYQHQRLALKESELALARLQQQASAIESSLKTKTGWDQPMITDVPYAVLQLKALQTAYTQSNNNFYSLLEQSRPPESKQLLAKKGELQREKLNHKIIAAGVRPKLNLMWQMQNDQVTSAGKDNVNRRLVQTFLQINWHIFDGFHARNKKLASKQRQRRIQRELEQIQRQKAVEIENIFQDRTLLCDDVALRQGYLALAANELDRVREEVKTKRLVEPDLETAQYNYDVKALALLNSEIGMTNNTCSILSLYGKDPFTLKIGQVKNGKKV